MALGDWLSSTFGSDADTTPANQTLANGGLTPQSMYQLTAPVPTTSLINPNPQGGQYGAAQSGLLQQLQRQAAGAGPDPSQIALKQATDQNIATQAALAAGNATGNQNPGVVGANLARTGAATQQTAAGQSAANKSQEQLAAEQGVGALSGQAIGQNLDLNNQGLTASAQNLGGYEFGQNLGANESNIYNNYLAQLTGQQEAQRAGVGASTVGAATQALGGVANSLGGAIQAFAAHGKIVDKPTVLMAGEKGREAIVPIHDDGSPDMDRARDPGLHSLLSKHASEIEGFLKSKYGRANG
jgi:hypothetical protein